jgi:hypothetical protein
VSDALLPHQCAACPPELRCTCDPSDLFEPPDPAPRAVESCPVHRARRAYQQWCAEQRPVVELADVQPTEDLTNPTPKE